MIRAAVLVLAAALALPALAQSATATVTFAAVDAVSTHASYFLVTGVTEGNEPVTSVTYFYSSSQSLQYVEACERYALLAMERPGRYRLEVTSNGSYLSYCRLVRTTP